MGQLYTNLTIDTHDLEVHKNYYNHTVNRGITLFS